MILILAFLEGLLALDCPPITGASVQEYATDKKCVYIFTEGITWIDAEKKCAEVGGKGDLTDPGTLVTIHTAEFDQWLYGKLTAGGVYWQSYWIGLRQICPTCPLEWIDLHPFEYENWQKGEPNGFGSETCVELHTLQGWPSEESPGLWNDLSCANTLIPICQYYPEGDPYRYTKEWPQTGGCPDGWWQFAGACYQIPTAGSGAANAFDLKRYDEAEKDCTTRGGDAHLAILTNRFHQAFIAGMLYKQDLWSRPYVGVLGAANDHYFYYVDSSRLVFSNWAAHKPSKGIEDRRCVLMDWHPDDRDEDIGQWSDNDCTTLRPYICTMSARADIPALPLTSPDVECPAGWLGYGHFCYKYVNTPSNQDGAEAICSGMTSEFDDAKVTVASVLHEYENSFILSFFGSDSTNRLPPSGLWLGLKNGYEGLKWSDGHHFDFANWAQGEPNNDNSKMFAMMNNVGRWMMVEETQFPFICKANPFYRKEEEMHELRGELLPCADAKAGWQEYKEYCIKVFKEAVAWSTAEDMCNKQPIPSNLASIHDKAMNEFLYSQAAREAKDEIWIGMTKYQGLGWQWTDRSSVGYTGWKEGEPSASFYGPQDCVKMQQSGYWKNYSCKRQTAPFICSHARQWSNCAMADIEKSPCGYTGITQAECMDTWKCCFDVNSEIPCFMPLGSPAANHNPSAESASTSGISPAGAAVLTAFFFVIVPVGFFVYSRFFSGSSGPWSTGFSNPTAA